MTPEDKQLLLIDLCTRLPYGVRIQVKEWTTVDTELKVGHIDRLQYDEIKVKPYLRPMPSMTEKEVDNLFYILKINEKNAKEWLKVNNIGIIRLFTEEGKDFYEIAEAIDYLNSVHIDYRELIEKGLAIEAPKGMYDIKEK